MKYWVFVLILIGAAVGYLLTAFFAGTGWAAKIICTIFGALGGAVIKFLVNKLKQFCRVLIRKYRNRYHNKNL